MFLKNKNIIFKTRRSKVTDYAAHVSDPGPSCYKKNIKTFKETTSGAVCQTLEPSRECPGPKRSGCNTSVRVSPKSLFVHRVDSTGATQEAQGPKDAAS